MKKVYKILSGIFALVGVIIAVSNITMTFPSVIFFKQVSQPLMFPFLLMMVIGMGTGFFLALGLMSGKGEESPSDFGGEEEF